jgi:hypothetical protein
MSQLWTLHGGASDTGMLEVMSSRAFQVLVEDTNSRWEGYQSICDDAVETAQCL